MIKISYKNSLGTLTISNPASLNAINKAMWQEIPLKLDELLAQKNLRAIIIKGDGEKAFSVGADIKEFSKERSEKTAKAYEKLNHQAFLKILSCPVPTIALINGHCLGGGFLLALSCDIRLGSDTARFSIPPAKLGLGFHPFWLQLVLRTIPLALAKDLFYTGRTLEAADALNNNILNHLYNAASFEQDAETFINQIIKNAPLTIKAGKAALDFLSQNSLDLNKPDHKDLHAFIKMADDCFHSNDYKEGQKAFGEKRSPVFKGS